MGGSGSSSSGSSCRATDDRVPAPAQLVALLPHELPGGSRVTFEPGGQLELSGPVAPTLRDACQAMRADTAAVRRALGPHDLDLVGVGGRHAGRRPPRAQRAAVPGDGRVLRHPVALRTHDDAQHRVGPGEPRHRAARPPSTPAGTWRTTSGPVLTACFANSPFDRSGRPTGLRSTRLGGVAGRSIPRAPAPPGTAGAVTAPTEWTRYAARRTGHDDPRRRTRQRRAAGTDDVRRLGRRRPRAPGGRRSTTSRTTSTTLFPPGPPAGMARAPHDRRAPRASGGRSRLASPRRCSTTRWPPTSGLRRDRRPVARPLVRGRRVTRSHDPALRARGRCECFTAARPTRSSAWMPTHETRRGDRRVLRPLRGAGPLPGRRPLDDWSRLQAATVA